MIATKNKEKFVTNEAPSTLSEQQFSDAVKNLSMTCQEVEYSVSWLPTSKTASEGTKNKMVDRVAGKKKGYSISKRLFCSDHPLIKELNQAKRRLDEWRDSFTIVKGADVGGDSEDKIKIVSGVRLIRDQDIATFDTGFKDRIDQLYAAADAVQTHMNKTYSVGGQTWASIKDMDRAVLGDDYNSADYPVDIRDCIRVTEPAYRDYTVSTRLPKAVYERECKRVHDALTGTIETAVAYLCETLNETFETLAKQLVNRTRVHPKNMPKFDGAEVVTTKTQEDGKIVVALRYKETDPIDPKKQRSIVEETNAMTPAEFKALYRPMETDEKKKITKSVIDNMMNRMENFAKLRSMLGEPGAQIDKALDKVRDVLSNAGSSSEDVVKEIKNANSFRKTLASALDNVSVSLADTAMEVRTVRRKLNKKLLAIAHDDE